MEVKYKSKSLEKVCTDLEEARKKHGDNNAIKIQLRIKQIKASPNATFMVEHSIGRCHPLKGNRKGKYAVDLEQPFRLVFSEEDGAIIIARIEEIVDYHKG